MGSPPHASPTRQKILRAGKRLLLTHGHAELSLRAIARAARLAPSSLYEHFTDREALLSALAEDVQGDLHADLARACGMDASARERLTLAALAYLRFAHTRPHEFELFFTRVQPVERTAPPPTSPMIPVLMEIQRALASGEIHLVPGLDALDLALSLWAQVHGIAVLRAVYLSRLGDVDERAAKIIAGTIDSWSDRVEGSPSSGMRAVSPSKAARYEAGSG